MRHFYSAVGNGDMADRGQYQHNAQDINPLCILLDIMREGRGTYWYPSLDNGRGS